MLADKCPLQDTVVPVKWRVCLKQYGAWWVVGRSAWGKKAAVRGAKKVPPRVTSSVFVWCASLVTSRRDFPRLSLATAFLPFFFSLRIGTLFGPS